MSFTGPEPERPDPGQPGPGSESTLALTLPTIDCDACRDEVLLALDRLDGVVHAHVDPAGRRASIVFDPAAVDAATIIDRLDQVGCPPAAATWS